MIEPAVDNAKAVFTIGHSTRTLEQFTRLLKSHGVTRVVDVRTIPRSRHNPQFNLDTLPAGLGAAGIGYTHLAGLGGLRHPRPDSLNTGWHNLSFRGFADYMASPQFVHSLGQLIDLAQDDTVAIMCVEAVPWRCHRSLIANELLVRGYTVCEIESETRRKTHVLTACAKVDGMSITYPANPSESNSEGVQESLWTAEKKESAALGHTHIGRSPK